MKYIMVKELRMFFQNSPKGDPVPKNYQNSIMLPIEKSARPCCSLNGQLQPCHPRQENVFILNVCFKKKLRGQTLILPPSSNICPFDFLHHL
jgi:hypothetical protein